MIRSSPCTRGWCHRAGRCLWQPCIAHPTASHRTQHTTRRRGHARLPRAAATTPAAAATTPAAAATTPGGQATPPPQGGATVVAKLTGGATPGTFTASGKPELLVRFPGRRRLGSELRAQRGRSASRSSCSLPSPAAAPARGTSTPRWRPIPPASRPMAVSNSSGPGATIDITDNGATATIARRWANADRGWQRRPDDQLPVRDARLDGRFSLVGGGAGGRLVGSPAPPARGRTATGPAWRTARPSRTAAPRPAAATGSR